MAEDNSRARAEKTGVAQASQFIPQHGYLLAGTLDKDDLACGIRAEWGSADLIQQHQVPADGNPGTSSPTQDLQLHRGEFLTG